MKDLQEFITKHLDLVFVFALVVLPLIFGRRKRKKAGKPKESTSKAGAGGKDVGKSLEEKVRKFFEQMVETSTPRPVSKPPFPSPEVEESIEMETAPRPRKTYVAKSRTTAPAGPAGFDPLTQQAPSFAGAHESPAAGVERRLHLEDKSGDVWTSDPELMALAPDDLEAPPAPETPTEPSRRIMDKRNKEAYSLEGKHGHHPASEAIVDRFSVASLFRLSRGDLKKAIVLKEILDPPVGLRM